MVVIFCVWQKNKVMLLSVAFILAFFSTEDPWVTKYWCSLSCYCFIVAMMLLIYCCYANVSLGFVSQRFVHKIYTECREWVKYGIGRFPELLYYICEKLMLLYIDIYIQVQKNQERIVQLLLNQWTLFVKWRAESMWDFSVTELAAHHFLLLCSNYIYLNTCSASKAYHFYYRSLHSWVILLKVAALLWYPQSRLQFSPINRVLSSYFVVNINNKEWILFFSSLPEVVSSKWESCVPLLPATAFS